MERSSSLEFDEEEIINDRIKITNDKIEMSKNKKKNSKSENNSEHIFKKLDFIHINNGWNDHNEKIIISIGENCASYKWMHDKCAIYYKIINHIINIASILFTSFLTAETFVIDNSNETITIIRKIITYSLSVISLLQNFLKVDNLQITHTNASNEFSILYHDIQQQMCRFRRERKNATRYVSECLKKYDSLVINNPDINNFILYRFKRSFKNYDIPSIEDRFNKIEIITENDQPKNNKEEINNNIEMNNINKDKIGSNVNVINVTNNLSNIHKMCKINGDISDNDLKNIDPLQLKRLNEQKMLYEYNRFREHSHEND